MAAINPFLEVLGLTKRIGDRVLFSDITFTINERDKIGLIAKNGTGKSTLLNIIAGNDGHDAGNMVFRNDLKVGYLPQMPKFDDKHTISEAIGDSLKAKQILTQLKITDLNQLMSELSGGQVKRVALAQVLVSEPNLLILDEPTNHLDLEMVEWLENFLTRSTMALLMVTHDRYFLDNVCNTIIEMDNHQLYTYQGNYSYYLEKRQERIEATNAELQRANNLYRTELEWMRSTPQARSHKARYRKDAFYELEKKVQQRVDNRSVRLEMGSTYIGSKIFDAYDVCKSFGEKQILKDFSYKFSRYEKMGIIGNNGTGKSTFIKMLLGLEPIDSGSFDIGTTVRFGYYSQQGMEIRQDQKVIDVVREIAEYVDLGNGQKLTASQFLQHFLFSPEEQFSYVYKLSGGEQRRLYLCTVLMKSPNFLVLDEPTNDLDIVTLQILEEYLIAFKGCLIIVSHDRYFMDKVVDHLMVFEGNGKLRDYPGSYTDYRTAVREEQKAQKQVSVPKKTADTSTSTLNSSSGGPSGSTRKRKLSFKEKREFEQLELDIAKLEEEKSMINEALCGGTTSVDLITQYSKRLPELQDELDEKEMRWLELSEIG